MIKKFILEIYAILKDITLFTSYSHKYPTSKIFNKLPYQQLRILFDYFLTKIYQMKIAKNFHLEKKETLNFGKKNGVIVNENFFSNKEIEKLKKIIEEIIGNYKSHNVTLEGSHLNKDKNSFSKYYYLPNYETKLSHIVSDFYKILYSKEQIMTQLKFLAGICLKKKEVSVYISKVKGELKSDDWHSDCFSHTSKSFIYLNDVNKNNSPFCFMKKSHSNKYLKTLNEEENSKKIFVANKNKNFSGDMIWNKLKDSKLKDEIFKASDIIECIYPKGTLITCDTSGFHKKGYSDGKKERFMIGLVSHRGSMLRKFNSIMYK